MRTLNPARARSAAESLYSWTGANAGPFAGVDDAYDAVMRRGQIFDPWNFEGLDMRQAHNDSVMGRSTPATQAVRQAYLDFYGGGATPPPAAMAAPVIEPLTVNDSGRALRVEPPVPVNEVPNASTVDNSWFNGPAANPARLEQAAIGGAVTVTGSGGPSTATPGYPAPPEQLAGSIDLSNSPKLQDALTTSVTLAESPMTDIRQLEATVRGQPVSDVPGSPVPPASSADEAVQRVRQGRRQGRRGQAVADATADAVKASAWLPADLGVGDWIINNSAKMAGKIPATTAAGHTAQGLLNIGGKVVGTGVKALPWVAAAAPTVMGAMEGAQSGSGGAAIQGGAAAVGSVIGGVLGAGGGPLGIAIGAGIGGSIGNMVGGAGRAGAVSAVEAAQGGDTGLAGQIGRSLDGVIDTPMEVESRQMVAQMNSPAVLALKAEERQRNAAERARMAQDLLMQAYARGIG